MAEIFVSAFVEVVFNKMASGGINMYLNMSKNRKRSKMIFEDWQRKLKLIEAVVRDAERTQFHSSAVKLWLQQLQDLAYDLEDIFDDFSIELMIDDDSHVGCTCSPFHKVCVISLHFPPFYRRSSQSSTSLSHVRLIDVSQA